MSKRFTITVYGDPGHAWGKVKRDILLKLGLEKEISRYSYQYMDNVYLEQDSDLAKVFDRLEALDYYVIFKEKHTDKSSKIRHYDRYEYGF